MTNRSVDFRTTSTRQKTRLLVDKTGRGTVLLQIGLHRGVRDRTYKYVGNLDEDFEWNSIRLSAAATVELRLLLEEV